MLSEELNKHNNYFNNNNCNESMEDLSEELTAIFKKDREGQFRDIDLEIFRIFRRFIN